MARIEIKRGAALRMQLTFQNDDGTPADLTSVTLTSQVRTMSGDLVTGLPIVRTAVAGVATVEVDDTTGWPIGELATDIQAVIGGVPVISETFGITVRRPITG